MQSALFSYISAFSVNNSWLVGGDSKPAKQISDVFLEKRLMSPTSSIIWEARTSPTPKKLWTTWYSGKVWAIRWISLKRHKFYLRVTDGNNRHAITPPFVSVKKHGFRQTADTCSVPKFLYKINPFLMTVFISCRRSK